jgi:hypothetical protein
MKENVGALVKKNVERNFKECCFTRSLPSGAEAPMFFWAGAARLKPRPFKAYL